MQSVKIYPAELGVSGWLETSTYKNHQFNHEDEILDEYDYVVVGAGYGGLGAATRLKELYPNAKIAVFEALRIGSNDSGKNAGFLIDVPHKFGDDVLTPEDEKWTVRLNVFAINKMREAVKANKLDVDWSEHGKYLAAREKRFWKILDHDREILDRMNMKYDDFDRRQLAERLGTGYYSRAIFNPGSVLINPAEVVRALFTTLGPNVHIFEKTPVMQIAGSETNPVVILLNGKKVRFRASCRQKRWRTSAASNPGELLLPTLRVLRFASPKTTVSSSATACFTALTIRVHLSRSDTRRNCCVRPLITASLIIRTLTSNTSGAA